MTKKSLATKVGEKIDGVVGVLFPKNAFYRKAFRFSYEALDGSRTRKKRTGLGGTGDTHLTAVALDSAREICRELCRNNPLVKGLLQTEANSVIGSATQIQARTGDEDWNRDAEDLWREEMVDQPCDVSGRFNFHAFLRKAFGSYRRDGDFLILLTDDGLQGIEGECCGTPTALGSPQSFTVTNGIAVSNETKKVIGYYIGKASKWGYIESNSYQKYLAENVIHVFNPERFSQSRGEPALISAIDFIDKLCGYIDAELVAAKVNACFSVFVTAKDKEAIPAPYTGGVSSTGEDTESKEKLQKLVPAMVWYGEPGEDVKPIGQVRPATAFDPFVMRMLTFIGRPLCIPLCLVTLDFSGATYMSTRVALGAAHDNWITEQSIVVKPIVRRIWLWKVQQWIADGKLPQREDWNKHEIICKRWEYVDPSREAQADELDLANGTTTRTGICARKGLEFKDIIQQRAKEDQLIKDLGLELHPKEQKVGGAE